MIGDIIMEINEYKKFTKLPESELRIMQLIWEMESAGESEISAGAMFEKYPDKIGHLALTTVLTLLTRLESKKFILCRKINRVKYYTSIVCEDDYKSQAAADFVASVYNNNSIGLLSALCNSGIISQSDIDELREMIQKNENDNDRS